MVPAAEHPSRAPQPWARAPRGVGTTAWQAGGEGQAVPASPAVRLASCRAAWQSPLCSSPRGKLLRTQRAWKPRVPICRPGKRWAAEEPRLPAPARWSWRQAEHPAGRCQEFQQLGRSRRAPNTACAALVFQETNRERNLFCSSGKHSSPGCNCSTS